MKLIVLTMIFFLRPEVKNPVVKKQTIEESCQEIMDALDGYSIEVQ